MPFPTTPILANLAPDEYRRLTRLLAVHYAYPIPYPLAGACFEELFALTVGGVREERKLLFDVLRAGIGWSLKTLIWSLEAESFEVVLQRCDILKDPSLSLDSPVGLLGRQILTRFNGFCEDSARKQNVADMRAGFLLRNQPQRGFIFFQQRYRLYEHDEVRWQWSNSDRNSLMGYAGDSLVLRWYRSGTQLFGVYRIPERVHRFHIDWRRAGLDETIAFLVREGVLGLNVEA